MRNFYSYAPFARTAVETLNRVEVLRGPSSVLYGQATNGGIINSVSKTPQFTPEGYVRLEYGSYDRKQAAVDLTGPLNGSGTLAGRIVGVVRDSEQPPDSLTDDRVLRYPSPHLRHGHDRPFSLC